MLTFNKSDIPRKRPLNIGGIICLTAGIYGMYYLLVQDILPCSITSILTGSLHHAKKWHLLTIGLMPIYLGLLIFGTSVISLYIGSALQRWFTQHQQKF